MSDSCPRFLAPDRLKQAQLQTARAYENGFADRYFETLNLTVWNYELELDSLSPLIKAGAEHLIGHMGEILEAREGLFIFRGSYKDYAPEKPAHVFFTYKDGIPRLGSSCLVSPFDPNVEGTSCSTFTEVDARFAIACLEKQKALGWRF